MPETMIVSSYALDQYIDLMGEEGKVFVIEIIDTLLEDFPRSFEQLDESLIENDFVTFQRAAHTLKSSCATVGANELADKFLELELSGESQNLASVDQILAFCRSGFQQLKNELFCKKRELQNLDTSL
jgi:HPt (histidine-containing phosphotransfer) domain-containing protein